MLGVQWAACGGGCAHRTALGPVAGQSAARTHQVAGRVAQVEASQLRIRFEAVRGVRGGRGWEER